MFAGISGGAATLKGWLAQLFLEDDQADLGLFTLENPCRDLAPIGEQEGTGIPSAEERHHIFHTHCQKHGHDWRVRGYANGAGPFNWLHWEIGAYRACSHCWARRFEQLETEDQLDVVLRLERERWKRQWDQYSGINNHS